MEVGGVDQSAENYTITGNETYANLIAQINGKSTTTGLLATQVAGTSFIDFYSDSYGTNIKVKAIISSGPQSGEIPMSVSAIGSDVAANIGGLALNGSGLVTYGNVGSTWAGTQISLTATAATTPANYLFSVAVGDLQFSLTDNGAESDLITYAIRNMQTNEIGTTGMYGNNGLDDIISGSTYALASNPAAAVAIIDQAIADVSMERAKLGAFQKFTLESTLNNLGTARENLSASESRIRDVDMAAEMMEFTKNQILVQAGTAMLAQANQLPQMVLKLLG